MVNSPNGKDATATGRSGALAQLDAVCDIVLVLDEALRITDVRASVPLGGEVIARWIGNPLSAIASPESLPKLPLLFADAGPEAQARWRHVNFLDGDDVVPLLVKYFGPTGPERSGGLIGARDLRPMSALQASYLSLQTALERCMDRCRDRSLTGRDGLIADVAHEVGRKSLSSIITETVQSLERRCLADALAMNGGDPMAAARVLGMSRAEFVKKARSLDVPLNVLAGTDDTPDDRLV